VIADVQLRFNPSAAEPLAPLEKSIKTGRCADLNVEKDFFKILMPNLSMFYVCYCGLVLMADNCVPNKVCVAHMGFFKLVPSNVVGPFNES